MPWYFRYVINFILPSKERRNKIDYADTALITAKLIIIAPVSAVEACPLSTVILKDPAATVETRTIVWFVVAPDRIATTTTSPTATVVFVTVNSAAAPAAREVVSV